MVLATEMNIPIHYKYSNNILCDAASNTTVYTNVRNKGSLENYEHKYFSDNMYQFSDRNVPIINNN